MDHVPDLHKGSALHAAKADISDWMYTDAKGVRGGYTVRVMLQDMSPAERAEYGLHFAD